MPLSPEAVDYIEGLRKFLLVENGGQSTRFCFEFDEEQVLELAAGYVPDSLKAAFRAALDWHEEDNRRAAAPARRPKKRARRDDALRAILDGDPLC